MYLHLELGNSLQGNNTALFSLVILNASVYSMQKGTGLCNLVSFYMYCYHI